MYHRRSWGPFQDETEWIIRIYVTLIFLVFSTKLEAESLHFSYVPFLISTLVQCALKAKIIERYHRHEWTVKLFLLTFGTKNYAIRGNSSKNLVISMLWLTFRNVLKVTLCQMEKSRKDAKLRGKWLINIHEWDPYRSPLKPTINHKNAWVNSLIGVGYALEEAKIRIVSVSHNKMLLTFSGSTECQSVSHRCCITNCYIDQKINWLMFYVSNKFHPLFEVGNLMDFKWKIHTQMRLLLMNKIGHKLALPLDFYRDLRIWLNSTMIGFSIKGF